MLVLSRKPGEKILIGDKISITVVRIAPGIVRIGVEAPEDLPILREELTTDGKLSAASADVHSSPEVKSPSS
jgi:carbon storage regulator